MDHTGLFHGLTAGSRSAKAVHADCHKQGSGMRSDMQNVANDGFFFNLDSHKNDLLIYFLGYYNPLLLKKQEGERIFSPDYSLF